LDKPSNRRCAIYTRKSSEEGLEQDFNSLQAQREACESYIYVAQLTGPMSGAVPSRVAFAGAAARTASRGCDPANISMTRQQFLRPPRKLTWIHTTLTMYSRQHVLGITALDQKPNNRTRSPCS
jgi:hypothetical protein